MFLHETANRECGRFWLHARSERGDYTRVSRRDRYEHDDHGEWRSVWRRGRVRARESEIGSWVPFGTRGRKMRRGSGEGRVTRRFGGALAGVAGGFCIETFRGSHTFGRD